jgi:hypothetical protein
LVVGAVGVGFLGGGEFGDEGGTDNKGKNRTSNIERRTSNTEF